MTFVHRPYERGETIAAVATPPGEGGVAIIRISGDRALFIAEKIYSGPIHSYKTHTVHFGKILDASKKVVDEVLLIVMRAPRSYTGEDTVEIHCHGGSLITRQVLGVVLEAGARAALPGEFTFKAFMNGKVDLAQAEAVQQLISAKNSLALHSAESHLQGALSSKIAAFQAALFDTASILEAWVDFPEEGLEFASLEEVVASLEKTLHQMQRLRDSFEEGKKFHEGLTLCLVGAPNVGKSSLMNALLGKERAIVTDVAGTTRDLLEAELLLGGLHFQLVDTAGIRETKEVVEKEGIRRSFQMLQKADLVLLVLDSTRGILPEDQEIIEKAPQEKTLFIWNKIDDASSLQAPPHYIPLSAKEGSGLDLLKEAIHTRIWSKGHPSKEEVVITQLRHKQALDRASGFVQALIEGLKTGVSPEFLSADMRFALRELGTIIGTDITEEILNNIFSKFCVGK